MRASSGTPSASRRAVLSTVAAAGATSLLAACSSGSGSSASASASAPASTSGSASASGSATPTTTPTGTATATGSASASAKATVKPKVTVTTVADLAAVKVVGAAGKKPTLTFPVALAAAKTVAKALIVGKGPKVVSGQEVTVDYTGYLGSTGKLFQSSYDSKATFTFTASTTAQIIKGFPKSVIGFPVGSRVLIAIDPTDGYGATAESGIPANSTLVFVVDIHAAKTKLTHAVGTAVPPKAGLPVVTVTKDIPTAIAKPTGALPKALVVQPLVKGTGPVLKKGDPVQLQYLAVLWTADKRSGTSVGSSWSAGTAVTVPALGASTVGSTTGLIKGLDQALTGQTVGSRILVVIPPALGYGTKGNGPIKATDDVVFCIDIIDNIAAAS